MISQAPHAGGEVPSPGHVALTRGTTYKPSGWDYLFALVTCGLWVLVIGIKAGMRGREVLGVAPDGSVIQFGGPEAPAGVLVLGVLALGALGLLVATVFSPMVAAVAVPVGVVLLGQIGE